LARLAAGLWIVGAIWYVLCEAIAVSGFEGYSYAHNYISDLGVFGRDVMGRPLQSHLHAVMTGAMVGQGVLFGAGAMVLQADSPPSRSGTAFLILALAHAFGVILVAMVPSQDIGSPMVLLYHGMGAVGAFVGGNLAIAALALSQRTYLPRRLRPLLAAVASAGLLALIVLIASSGTQGYVGAWERGTAYAVMLGEFLAGIGILQGIRKSI
jgi:hypothetical membrane protein